MRDAVDHAAAACYSYIEGQALLVVGQRGNFLDSVGKLHDGVGALGMVVASMRAAPFGDHMERGAAFAPSHQAQAARGGRAGLEDQAGACVFRQVAQRGGAEIIGESLFRCIQAHQPVSGLQRLAIDGVQGIHQHINHHRAAFDIICARAIDALARRGVFPAPGEPVGYFFLGGKDSVHVRDQGEGWRCYPQCCRAV